MSSVVLIIRYINYQRNDTPGPIGPATTEVR
jgi:hypothetical protein